MELNFAVFVLLTGICYDTETSVILLHLNTVCTLATHFIPPVRGRNGERVLCHYFFCKLYL